MPITKITSNVLASGVAQDNLNAGSSITLSKTVTINSSAIINGDFTVQGSISASDSVFGSNIVYNGGNTTAAPLSVGTNTDQNLIFETNGLSRMTVTSAGNVGIGVSAPNERLQVTNGNIGTYGSGNGFVMYNLGQGNYSGNFEMARFMPVSNEFLFQTLQGGTGVGRNLRFAVGIAGITLVNSSGNIGVGTVTPNERLSVSGNVSVSGVGIFSNGSLWSTRYRS